MSTLLETLVPCCGTIFMLGLLLGFAAFWRYMGYREVIELADKGFTKPEWHAGNSMLFWGLAFSSTGLALMLGLWPIGFLSGSHFPLGFGPWMLAGLLPMFFGLGLILFYIVTHEGKKPDAKELKKPATRPSESMTATTAAGTDGPGAPHSSPTMAAPAPPPASSEPSVDK